MTSDYHYNFQQNLFSDIIELRKFIEKVIDPYQIINPTLSNLVIEIIEREHNRKLQQQNSANEILSPTEKQKLEQERDSYKDKFNSVCKWFEYYQDKSKELEYDSEIYKMW